MSKIILPKYNLGEEIINSISHGLGGGLSIAALILCLIKTSNTIGRVSCVLYGVLMILLYVISCIYHVYIMLLVLD